MYKLRVAVLLYFIVKRSDLSKEEICEQVLNNVCSDNVRFPFIIVWAPLKKTINGRSMLGIAIVTGYKRIGYTWRYFFNLKTNSVQL
jgi:hypothetical protein